MDFRRFGGRSTKVVWKIFFFQIWRKGGNRDNPDAQQFRAAIRDVMVDCLMITCENKNCENDTDSFLSTLEALVSAQSSNQSVRVENVSGDNYVIEALSQQEFAAIVKIAPMLNRKVPSPAQHSRSLIF